MNFITPEDPLHFHVSLSLLRGSAISAGLLSFSPLQLSTLHYHRLTCPQPANNTMAPDDDEVHTPAKGVGIESNESKSLAKLPAKSTNGNVPGLYDIFSNPILLASLLVNFTRDDYNFLAQVAALIPGLNQEWPAWDHLVQPCPRKFLSFNICSLRVQCQNEQRHMRRLIADDSQPSPSEYTMCHWTFNSYNYERCCKSEKHLSLRLKPGDSTSVAKTPPEFFECVGFRIMAKNDDDFLPDDLRIKGRYSPDSVPLDGSLANYNSGHRAGHIVCSECANQSYITNSTCLWRHDRMIPLCRDCSENPRADLDGPYGWAMNYPSRPVISDNIHNFSQSLSYLECNCFEEYSPANGYHLCASCADVLDCALEEKFQEVKETLFRYSAWFKLLIYEVGNHVQVHGRNFCPCGKTWGRLLKSWEGFTQEERDKKMYRMCLLCTGHIPRNKIMTANPTNCL